MKTSLILLLSLFALLSATEPLVVFFIDPTSTPQGFSGDAILVCTPAGRNYLIDGGMLWNDFSDQGWDCGTETILPLLDSLDITYLDGIVGTHPHADHIGGLIAVLNNMPVTTAYDSEWPYGGTWTYEEFLDAIYRNGSNSVTPRRGDILNWGSELTVEVIHPVDPLAQSNENNASITIRLTYGEISFLFTGDLETSGGEDIILAALASGDIENISADVLKVGHHGSYTSTCNSWLAAVDPSIAAICVGRGNEYGHPHGEVINRLNMWDIDIYRTDEDGTFYISTDGEDLYYDSMPPETGGTEPDPPAGFSVYPSPATDDVTFAWDATDGVTAAIVIYNLNGEKVKEITNISSGIWTWTDMRLDNNSILSSGLYAAVFTTSGGETWVEYFAVSR